MDNKNRDQNFSWIDRGINRFKQVGTTIPMSQLKVYKSLKDRWVSGKTVIDIGSSLGVGANILSHTARHVWGVDINEEAVKFANDIFARPNLSFEVMDIENPTDRELAPFEVVVMSEVIEHLDNPEQGLNFVKRFFNQKTNTVGFITAPNINNPEVKARDAENFLHMHRWDVGQFYEFMIQHFHSVTLFNGDIVDYWTSDETIDGTSTCKLIVAKVEQPK